MNSDVILIEDDEDDRDFFHMAFQEVCMAEGFSNKLVILSDSAQAVEYLQGCDKPLAVVSDINMPRLNGLELKELINRHPDLKVKCYPFLYLTTSDSNQQHINQAHELFTQGFFVKPVTVEDYRMFIRTLLNYWRFSRKPEYSRYELKK